MQYKSLIELLDSLIDKKARVPSAKRNRPESSSPEKLKMRNPTKVTGSSKGAKEKASAEAVAQEEDDEQYTDEEIAKDPDDSDEGELTKGLFNLNQLEKKSSSSSTEKGRRYEEDDDEPKIMKKVSSTAIQKPAAQDTKKKQTIDGDDDDYA